MTIDIGQPVLGYPVRRLPSPGQWKNIFMFLDLKKILCLICNFHKICVGIGRRFVFLFVCSEAKVYINIHSNMYKYLYIYIYLFMTNMCRGKEA